MDEGRGGEWRSGEEVMAGTEICKMEGAEGAREVAGLDGAVPRNQQHTQQGAEVQAGQSFPSFSPWRSNVWLPIPCNILNSLTAA